jgi:hypothetical protein
MAMYRQPGWNLTDEQPMSEVLHVSQVAILVKDRMDIYFQIGRIDDAWTEESLQTGQRLLHRKVDSIVKYIESITTGELKKQVFEFTYITDDDVLCNLRDYIKSRLSNDETDSESDDE